MSDQFVIGAALVFVPRDVLFVVAAAVAFAGAYWLAARADRRNVEREAERERTTPNHPMMP